MNWSIVPEIGYDIIARVVPGAVLLTLGALIACTCGVAEGIQKLLNLNKDIVVASLPLTMVLSYFVSIIMQPIGQMILPHVQRPWVSKAKQDQKNIYENIICPHIEEEYSLVPIRDAKGKRRDMAKYICINKVLHHDPSQGLRLLKIRAEKSLCESLFAGLLLLLVYDVWVMLDTLSLQTIFTLFLKHPGGRELMLVLLAGSMVVISKWKTELDYEHRRSISALWFMVEAQLPMQADPSRSSG